MGKFAEKARTVIKQANTDWQARLAEQQARLGQAIPSSQDEAMAKARALLQQLGLTSYNLGYGLRNAQHQNKDIEQLIPHSEDPTGVPGREKMINIPATDVKTAEWFEPKLLSKQALLGFLTEPIGNKLEEMSLDLRKNLDERKQRATRVTSDPSTLPTFYPAAALSVPKNFIEGYQAADRTQHDKMRLEMDQRLEKARKEFETALADEYSASRAKSASCLIDGLAKLWTGELQVKEADGELNQLLGAYLAGAGVLGVGTHHVVKGLWEKRDPRYQRLKAMKDLIRQRQRHNPLPVLVTEEHIPAEALAHAEQPPAEIPASEDQPQLTAV